MFLNKIIVEKSIILFIVTYEYFYFSDAAKRKQLPAWIREGLEKMEREKRRKVEHEQSFDESDYSSLNNENVSLELHHVIYFTYIFFNFRKYFFKFLLLLSHLIILIMKLNWLMMKLTMILLII